MNQTCCNEQCAALNSSWLRDVTKQDRCNAMEHAIALNLRKGQNLFLQGGPAQGFYCVKTGVVIMSLATSNGDRITVDIYAGRGAFGHHCLISPTNLYTATCLTDTQVCCIPKSVILGLRAANPSLDAQLWKKVSHDYTRLNETIASLRSRSVLHRTAEVLIRLQTTFGTDESQAINFYTTKEELANMIGSSVESVFRALHLLRQKKYIAVEKSRIWIKNATRLREIARARNVGVNTTNILPYN